MKILYLLIPLAFILAREFLFMQERKQWIEERQKLIDRIQARDLPEYKAYAEPVKVVETKKEEPSYEIV